MKGKWGAVAGAVALVAVGWFVLAWIGEQSADPGDVGYSPLYQQRVIDALVPVTSQAVQAQQQSVASQCTVDEPTCQRTCDCETQDCQSTVDYPTCVGETCASATCAGFATCESSYTCAEMKTCDSATCEAGTVCDEPTIDSDICEWTYEGPYCEGPTLEGTKTCDVYACDLPTYRGGTCERPTCDGPTCFGPTCAGDTCFLADCEVWDYGDAPDGSDFPERLRTLLANDGARHLIDGVYYLGVREDVEIDGRPTRVAIGDDDPTWSSRDDEDGIWFVTTLVPGEPAVVIVAASHESYLNAWIDYDGSGTWLGESDRLFDEPHALHEGYNWIWFTVPADAEIDNLTYARFRMSGSNNYRGPALRGEVEDYRVSICSDFSAWILTDEILYEPGDPIALSFYVSDIAQVSLLRHRPDGQVEIVMSGTFEPGRHEFPEFDQELRAEAPYGAETLELVVTGLRTGCTAWLTTPYVTAAP